VCVVVICISLPLRRRRRLHPIVVCPSIRLPCPYACKTAAAVLARPNYPSQGSPRTSVSHPPSPRPFPLPRARPPPPPHCPVSLTKVPRGPLTTNTSHPSQLNTTHTPVRPRCRLTTPDAYSHHRPRRYYTTRAESHRR